MNTIDMENYSGRGYFVLDHFKIFSRTMRTNIYVKDPNLSNYTILQSKSATPADLHLQEATIFETLLKHGHKNIAQYLGYLEGTDGRIKGLCFRKYKETLLDRLQDPDRPLNTS